MNVLCCDQFGELGGAQRCLLDLIPAMAQRGWSVHLAAPAGPLQDSAAALGSTVDPIRSGPYSSGNKSLADMARFAGETPRLGREFRALAKRYAANLIYVNGPRLLPAAAMAARKGPPVLFHAHSLLDGPALRAAGIALEKARAAMVASCRFVAEPLLAYSGDRGIRIVYNGVRRMALPPRNRESGEFRIGVIGRIALEKGQADFLRAARILRHAAPQCRYIVCGGPLFSNPEAMRYCAFLEELATGLPVEFTGWTDDVESILGSLDLLAVPSTAVDATPRVILEAFAAGVPVVAFASGGIPEIVEDGVTGFLVGQRTPKALALAMLDAVESPDRAREVAACARKKARTEFSLERYRRQVLDAMEAACRSMETAP